MNSGVLSIYFVETIDVSSIDFTGITLQRLFNATSAAEQHSLTGGVRLSREDSTRISILLNVSDLNEIKRKKIGENSNSSYLVVERGFIVDMNDQPVRPLLNGISALKVKNYTADSTPPILETFELDVNSGELILVFDETVRRESVVPSRYELLSADNASVAVVHSLKFESVAIGNDSTRIKILLGKEDQDDVKRLTALATSLSTTFVRVLEGGVEDMVGNGVQTSPPIRASLFVADTSSPTLVSFSVNMDSKEIVLTFSETVNASSVRPIGITLYGTSNRTDGYTLTGGTVTPSNDPVIIVKLDDFDFNEIKKLALGRNENSTFN